MELIVVLVVVLVIVGPKKLPSAGRSMGEGLRGFKDALTTSDAKLETEHPERDRRSAEV
jgi:sec-independent protein translocase protein TatA